MPAASSTLLASVKSVKNVFMVKGERSKSCVEMCEYFSSGGIHFNRVASRITRFLLGYILTFCPSFFSQFFIC